MVGFQAPITAKRVPMSANHAELAQRLAATRPEDSVRGLFFNAVLQHVEERCGLDARRELVPASREGGYRDLRSFPATEFLALLFAGLETVRVRHPEVDSASFFYACGEASVRKFQSGIGAIFFGVLGRADRHRLGGQGPRAYATAVSYGKRSYTEEGEKLGRFRVDGDMLPPDYHRGVLEASYRALGHPARVALEVRAIDAVDYLITWS